MLPLASTSTRAAPTMRAMLPCRLPQRLLRRPCCGLQGLPRQLQQGHHRLCQVPSRDHPCWCPGPLRLQQRLPGHQLRQRHAAELRAQLPGQLLPRLHRCAQGLATPAQTLKLCCCWRLSECRHTACTHPPPQARSAWPAPPAAARPPTSARPGAPASRAPTGTLRPAHASAAGPLPPRASRTPRQSALAVSAGHCRRRLAVGIHRLADGTPCPVH